MQRTRRKSDISSIGSVKLRTTKKTPAPSAVTRRASMPSIPLDKVEMLIMEANEITQYLQKDYLFSKYDGPVVPPGGDREALIKITNKKLGVSCVWTLTKLKERLVKMRKLMYAGEAECSGIGGKSVFFDSNDEWTKSDAAAIEQKVYPKVAPKPSLSKINGRSLQTVTSITVTSNGDTVSVSSGFNGSNTKELSADTDYLPTTPSSGHNDSGLPDKYFTSSDALDEDTGRFISPKTVEDQSCHGNTKVKARHVDTQQQCQRHGTPMLTVCREMMTLLVDREKDKERQTGLVDKILSNCESVKTAVINILEFYTQVQETNSITAAEFADCDLVRVTSIHLVAALELLLTHTSLWCATHQDVESSVIRGLDSGVTRSVEDLSMELVTFLQGCEQNNETVAHDSASKVTDLLFGLVKQCGELAAATNTCPSVSLRDPPRESIDQLMCIRKSREDALCVQLSIDLKQALLGGTSVFVLTTLHTGISTLEAAERTVEGLVKDCHMKCQNSEDIMRHVTIVVTKGKLLVRQCHQVQVMLDAAMKEDGEKSPDYFYHFFVSGQSLTSHVNTLVDNLSLLIQASQPLTAGLSASHNRSVYNLSLLIQASQPLTAEKDCGSLKKVCRCADLVDSATLRLVRASNVIDLYSSTTSSVSCTHSSVSEDEHRRIKEAGYAVNLATKTLVGLVQKHLTLNLATNRQRTRRMLPATPGGRPPPAPSDHHPPPQTTTHPLRPPPAPSDHHPPPQTTTRPLRPPPAPSDHHPPPQTTTRPLRPPPTPSDHHPPPQTITHHIRPPPTPPDHHPPLQTTTHPTRPPPASSDNHPPP
ncbi:hypothetical protein LSAT2_011159 [Lamellibrachia satsuma]|nr:hypothetical protein LSAT2_011159 [Lamellibrachia satsuma]